MTRDEAIKYIVNMALAVSAGYCAGSDEVTTIERQTREALYTIGVVEFDLVDSTFDQT